MELDVCVMEFNRLLKLCLCVLGRWIHIDCAVSIYGLITLIFSCV
jgi:hypothetical protein